MPIPILFFAAAGALAGTGLGGGVYLWRKGSQHAAHEEAETEIDQLSDLIRRGMDLAELREAAETAGVDVESVIAGYKGLRDGYLSLPDVVENYLSGKAPVQTHSTSSSVAAIESGEVVRATPAEVRAWAKGVGLDVADRGPIPGHVLEAYRAEHDWRHAPPSTGACMVWGLQPGESIRRKDLHDEYGGKRQGGISPSNSSPNIMIFTDPETGHQHGYLDRWEEGILHYTGEGQTGPQHMTHGNLQILKHAEQGRALRIFEGSSGEVTYVGRFELDDPPYYHARAARQHRTVRRHRMGGCPVRQGPCPRDGPQGVPAVQRVFGGSDNRAVPGRVPVPVHRATEGRASGHAVPDPRRTQPAGQQHGRAIPRPCVRGGVRRSADR